MVRLSPAALAATGFWEQKKHGSCIQTLIAGPALRICEAIPVEHVKERALSKVTLYPDSSHQKRTLSEKLQAPFWKNMPLIAITGSVHSRAVVSKSLLSSSLSSPQDHKDLAREASSPRHVLLVTVPETSSPEAAEQQAMRFRDSGPLTAKPTRGQTKAKKKNGRQTKNPPQAYPQQRKKKNAFV